MTIDQKKEIFNTCLRNVDSKINEINLSIKSVDDAIHSETKSTLGDKHETSRVMLQLEREKLGNQMKELEEQKSTLEKIDITPCSDKIKKGSFVITDKGAFFVSIALGKLKAGNVQFYAISASSPLGNKLLGEVKNNLVEINNVTYKILEIN